MKTVRNTAGRARYTAAQGLRSAWYGGQYAIARRRSAGFNRPGEPVFKPSREPDLKTLRKAYFDLFREDRAHLSTFVNIFRRHKSTQVSAIHTFECDLSVACAVSTRL